MSVVAVLLIAIGIADLLRPLTTRLWLPATAAAMLVAGGAALCGLWHRGDLLLVGIAVLAGQLSVATAVIAAKSIIRFPEISAQKAKKQGGIGIDDVTEFFLIGSFASWIVALGGLALAATAAR